MLDLNRHVDLSVWKPLGSSVTRQKVRSQHCVQISFIAGLRSSLNSLGFARIGLGRTR